MMAGWSQDDMDRVKALVAGGLTFGKIGAQMGRTRSAVAGLASRLGIKSNNAPVAVRRAACAPFPLLPCSAPLPRSLAAV